MLNDRLSKLGDKTLDCAMAPCLSAESEGGRSRGSDGKGDGSWWRKDVRMWELWILTGSSTRMSW